MNRKIKSFGLTAVVSLVLIMGYMVAPPVLQPDNYVQTGEQVEQHSDVKLVEQPDDSYMLGLSYVPEDSTPNQAEAIVPAVIGAGALGAVAGVSYGFYKGYKAGQFASESKINASEADDVVRTNVHDAAISADGEYDSWADGLDNNLNTIEGSALQVVNNELINEADNLTSESETVVLAENTVSDYLWSTQENIVAKHNFNSYDLAKNQIRKLDSANYSNDYYVENLPTVKVASESELSTQLKDSKSEKILLANDINVSSTINLNSGQSDILDLNGYNITSGVTIISTTLDVPDIRLAIRNGAIDTTGSYVVNAEGGNLTLENIDLENQNKLRLFSSGNIYDGTGNAVIEEGTEVNSTLYGNLRLDDVTLNPADVEDANLQSDIVFEHNNSTANLTAINVSVAGTYANSKEAPLQVAMPYINTGSGYQPMDYANGSKLYVDTPTSGIYDRVEPVQFDRFIDIIQTRDSRSDAVYSTVSSHASNTWNDTIKTVASDDNLSVTDFKNVTDDLSIFNVDNLDPRDTDAVLAQYAGIYDSVAKPSDTRINLVEQSTDTNYNDVVLFSTDLQTLMNQTNNSSVLEVNDQFNASDVSRIFVVDPEIAEVSELEGNVKITGLTEDGQSVNDVDIQTFDLKSTDLSKQANSIKESVDVTIETVDSAQEGDNGGFVIPPIVNGGNGAGTLVILAIIAALILRRRQNGGRRNNNSIDN